MAQVPETPGMWGRIPLAALAAAVCLLLAGLVMAVVNERSYEARKLEEARVQARILAATMTAALAFHDRTAGQEYVDALKANPLVRSAAVFDENGQPFVAYAGGAAAARVGEAVVEVSVPVVQGDLPLGRVFLRTVREPLDSRLNRYVGVGLLVVMASLVVVVLGVAHAAVAHANIELKRRAVALGEAYDRLRAETSEREKAEDALRQSQKMEAVGQLTGGVAHDFNNLLQVIGGSLELLRPALAGNAPAAERLAGALAAVARGAKLTGQLLAFARRQPLEPGVVNLGRFVRGMDDMLRRVLGEDIVLETVVGSGLWNTLVDPAQVQNVILNLAINARDAMPEGGRLTIEVANVTLDEHDAARRSGVEPGRYVMLTVTDSGCGMPPEVRQRVFEPFFTTKSEGKGTGLGLSMVYGVVKQSGGHVTISSEVGAGTTIRIYLPPTHRSETVDAEPAAEPSRGGGETILVVEDDAEVRATAVAMLTDLGYRVLQAADGEAGLAVLASGEPVDLLFTDVVMPGPVRSTDLASRARRQRPGIAVLFTSGYAQDAIVHGGRLDEGVNLLSKPYGRDALAAKIRQTLGARPPARPLRVLLVEDDALIRMTTGAMLEAMGCSVTEAGDADGALAVMEREEVDVLLTDVTLPRMSGTELAVHALNTRAGLRVVFATGRHLALEGPLADAAVLTKPYTEQDLRRVLQ